MPCLLHRALSSRLLSIQFFECLNVATQVLCAAYLGSGEIETARAVMLRIMFLGVLVASVVGVVVTAYQMPFALSFTSDPAVIAQVWLYILAGPLWLGVMLAATQCRPHPPGVPFTFCCATPSPWQLSS